MLPRYFPISTDSEERSERRFMLVTRLGLCSAAIVGFGLVASVNAAVVPYIGVNFLGGASDGGQPTGAGAGSPSQLDATPPGLTAGVVPQNNWNDVGGASGTTGLLHDSSGAATGVTLTFASSGSVIYSTGATAPVSDPNAAGDTRLMNGYVDGLDNGTNTYTFNGVSAGTYDVIAYALPDSLDGRTSHYTLTVNGVGGTTYYLKSDGGELQQQWIRACYQHDRGYLYLRELYRVG